MATRRWSVGVTAALAIALVAGGICWLVGAGRRQLPPARPVQTVPEGVEVHLKQVRLQGIAGGKVIWEVEADDFDLVKGKPLLRITGLRKVALIQEGKTLLTVSAGAMEQNTRTGDISLRDNVMLTGPELLLRAPAVSWDARREEMTFPGALSAQVGEYTLRTQGSVAYDVKAAILRCDGRVALAAQGNTLEAGSASLEQTGLRLTLNKPVIMRLDVADLEAWAVGHSLPAIPEIPAEIKERYRNYLEGRGPRTSVSPPPPRQPSPGKGARP